jgi:hypothetical protein
MTGRDDWGVLMRAQMIFGTLLVGLTACFGAYAAPQMDQCSGILHRGAEGLRMGGGRGEGEGICVIRKADELKVLEVCRVGRFCRVRGLIDLCRDSGECVEIHRVTSVRRQ